MSTVSSGLKRWAEIAKNLAEVLAIVVGGGWAVMRFNIFELPTMVPRLQVSSTLDWSAGVDQNHCVGRFGVTVKNIGVTAAEVRTLRIRAWQVDAPVAKDEAITYLDPNEFQRGKPDFDRAVESESLTGTYDSGTESHDDWVFTFSKSPRKLALFRVDVRRAASRAGQPDVEFLDYRWGDKCEGADEKR